MQGFTSDTQTTFIVLIPNNSEVEAFYRESRTTETRALPTPQVFFRDGEPFKVLQYTLYGLSPSRLYELGLRSPSGDIDMREFKTLDTSKTKARFAVVSCLDDRFTEQSEQWLSLLSQKPDFILMIGDNVYVDVPGKVATPETLWQRYTQTRNTLEIFKTPRLVPVFAGWDDHDYGAGDGDKNYPYQSESLSIFSAFFGSPSGALFEKGPGNSKSLRLFGQELLVADDRSFRSPDQKPLVCEQKPHHPWCQKSSPSTSKALKKNSKSESTHFGLEQEAWIFKHLQEDPGPFLLISGDQWFGGYHPFESFEGNHPDNFKNFIGQIKKMGKKVVFISGDRHLSELMKIEKEQLGYESYEITSSALHARVHPSSWDIFPNPRQLNGVAQVMNYTLLETTVGKDWELGVKAFGPNRHLLYEKSLVLPLKLH